MIQGTAVQLLTVPFAYNPYMDMGSLLQVMSFMFILGNTAWAFTPGKIAQYWRIQQESDIGLITARGITFLCLLLHDLFSISLAGLVMFAIHSTAFEMQRYTLWEMGLGGILINMHWTLVSASYPFSGVPFPLCNLVQLVSTVQFLYCGGFMGTNVLIGTRSAYVSEPTMFMQLTTNRSAYPPGTQMFTSPDIEIVFAVLWLLYSLILLLAPSIVAELSDLRIPSATYKA